MQNKYLLRSALAGSLLLTTCVPYLASAQGNRGTQVPLTDLSAFSNPTANWSIAGGATADFNKHNTLTKKDGTGVLVNIPGKGENKDIFSVEEHGDLDLSFDFIMPKESNSGIYLQGRYEIQLLDSWGKQGLSTGDLGAVYQRWDETRPAGQFGYDGVVPRINVARAPGLWQNMRILFQAPKFNGAGEKIANARIVRIILNGVPIIENAELQGPTRGSAFPNEAEKGPLRIQGDHGAVAIKNVRYNTDVNVQEFNGDRRIWDASEHPVTVEVKGEPVVFRSFVDIPGKRVTHAANVGFPKNINFGYDLSNGAIFQVWKGGFVDASPMWLSRGDGNSRAIGSVLPLGDKPALAIIGSDSQAWPDTLATLAFRPKGYELDEAGVPTFKYLFNGVSINDKIVNDEAKGLVRTISIDGPAAPKDLYVRAANGSDVVELENGLYAVHNFTYYVKIDKALKPVIRNTPQGKEVIIPIKNTDKGTSVQYSIIW